MIKILGKIDLPVEVDKFKFKDYYAFLNNELFQLAKSLNQGQKILNSDGSIIVKNKQQAEKVADWQAFNARKFKISQEEYLDNKEKSQPVLAEKTITLLLNRLLADKFIVVRASAYDDLQGVDNVILDKKTGNVVCGFDDVLSHIGDDGRNKKSKKVRDIMLKGGINLEHGLSFNQEKQLEIKRLNNLPAFYLSLSKEELKNILKSFKQSNQVGNVEKKVLGKFINSIEDQLNDLPMKELDYRLLENINNFKISLASIKQELI